VAQRTGATIYYVELFPKAAAVAAGKPPVLALMPLPGDVDVVLASELMEAGRAVQRGLVTPDRTTLITSTHRVYAIAEKVAMGDGRAHADVLLQGVQAAARRFVGYDMAAAAEAAGSVISAVLLGTLAGTGVLPFTRAQFEATIERGGVGVKPSLKAFGLAFDRAAAAGQAVDAPVEAAPAAQPLPRSPDPAVQALIARAAQAHSGETLRLVMEGLRRLVDYQDVDYAALYLDRLQAAVAPDGPAPPPVSTPELMQDLARHLALWMSYEDTIRVADLKTRGTRFDRVQGEVRASAQQLLTINEYLHPRLQEVAETLPGGLGPWLLKSTLPRKLVQRLCAEGRVVQTSSLRGYLMLRAVAGLRRWRRSTLRYAAEQQRIEAWLADIRSALHNPALALEITRCQRLVKGYGDTHERGLRNYALLRAAWAGGATADQVARLRTAALADENGHALAAALQQADLPHAAAVAPAPQSGIATPTQGALA
jgi:indolepyruvate ferredoxin oxidoreductase beta subunit